VTNPQMSLWEALAVTAEIYGRSMSKVAAKVLAQDLSGYPLNAVIASLGRCRRELKHFPSVAEIIERIDDGRPGIEAAWALCPKDEHRSVCWTDEMARAFAIASPLLPDMIAARMAFKEEYSKLVMRARDEKKEVRWSLSLGHDPAHRETVVLEAAQDGKLPLDYAKQFVPLLEHHHGRIKLADQSQSTAETLKQIQQLALTSTKDVGPG